MNEYVIVTESGADLSESLVEKYHLKVLPMHVEVYDKDYLDGSISIDELCGYYNNTGKIPKTSAVSPNQYQEFFASIRAEKPDAVIIHISYSAKLSCTYQNAQIAADNFTSIYHIDSKNVSAGYGFVVVKAAQLIEKSPDITPEELTKQIEAFADLAHFSFIPGNLDYLRAGGRVSNAQYLGASILRIKPLIEVIDGEMLSTKKFTGSMKRVITKMIDGFFSSHNIGKDIIFFADAHEVSDATKAYMEEFIVNLGVKESVWLKTGAVITSHSGPGGIGIAGMEA